MIKKHLSHTWMIELRNRGTKPSRWLAYLLGLLAMIKCSICSYQCDNWYVSNWRLACHINFSLGRCPLELAQGPSRVALAWHKAGGSTPFGVTSSSRQLDDSTIAFMPANPRYQLVWPASKNSNDASMCIYYCITHHDEDMEIHRIEYRVTW